MTNILETLADSARSRVAAAKARLSLDALKERVASTSNRLGDFAFERALQTDDVAFICECKKASPSKGLISPEFPYLEIAREYAASGAECVSVLTEPTQFLGSNDYLAEIARAIDVPCLRKDFVVDEYMIYNAKALGASAVLLICSILDDAQLGAWLELCDELGLSALVEAHDAREIARAMAHGARVIGVNNRNLKDFTVDFDASRRLRDLVGDRALFVAESGLKTASDVDALRAMRADAALVGETLMRSSDVRATLAALRGRRG